MPGPAQNRSHAALNSRMQSSRSAPVPCASSPPIGTTVSIAHFQKVRAPAPCWMPMEPTSNSSPLSLRMTR